MKMKTMAAILFVVLSGVCGMAATQALNPELRIYLPREITIETQTPTLADVAIVRGSDTLTEQAGKIALGRLCTADQDLLITRDVILSRLACSGIDTDKVTLTGAKEVNVTRNHQQIDGNKFATAATLFLNNHLPDKSICKITPVRLPNAAVITENSEATSLKSQLISYRGNQCKVRTTVISDRAEITSRDTVFLCRYQTRKIVATTPIAKGQMLNPDNIRIENAVSNSPQPAGWSAPYGQVARRTFSTGAEIQSHLVASPTPEVLLKRNQAVAIVINCPGFVATASGTALQDGATGQLIKVKNTDSQKIIMAKVMDNGTVEPVF
ncbi:MAG: flagellar basal body P-ring formation chaperone FlgA [Planctomycetota bacterium]|jgi:flagella basal body P-ring formation protein FlgA